MGSVDFTTTTVGSLAQYTCQEDAMLVGMSVLECLPSDMWSGTAPRCIGMYVFVIMKLHTLHTYNVINDVRHKHTRVCIYNYVCSIYMYVVNVGWGMSTALHMILFENSTLGEFSIVTIVGMQS